MNYLAIGLIIIIVIIVYYTYYYLTNNSLTSGLQDLSKQIVVSYDKLINPNAMTYSYQCWLYISSSTVSSPIFYRKSSDGSTHNEFEVDLSGQILELKAGTGSTAPIKIMTITNNFPIQKWTYLVVNVKNLKTFEAYINGKLAKTINIDSTSTITPTFKTSALHIGNNGITGYVTKFIRQDKILDAKTIWETYLSGNGLTSYFNSFIPYGLNMSISKGEELQRVVNIF
jgi:hypothetical protein